MTALDRRVRKRDLRLLYLAGSERLPATVESFRYLWGGERVNDAGEWETVHALLAVSRV